MNRNKYTKQRVPLHGHTKNDKLHTKASKILILALVFLFLLFAYSLYKLLTLDKFIYVNKDKGGNAEIVIIDPKSDKNIKYYIDGETTFNSSRGYGEYKLASLWQLSEKDSVKGKLIAETIVKNMYLPVYLWKDGKNSNLNLYQKIKSFFFERRSSDYDSKLDISDISNSVYINFIDPSIEDQNLTIEVQDLTGEIDTINKISKVIEISGGKITLNTKGYDENMDCEISGSQKIFIDRLSKVLDCESKITVDKNIVIKLGAKFAERF